MDTLTAMLLSRDFEALLTAKRALGRYAIQTHACRTALEAAEILKFRQFDFFVLDFDLPGIGAILQILHARGFGAARNVIVLGSSEYRAAEWGPLQVRQRLAKPFTSESLEDALKASYRMIAMEKRTYFRCAVRLDATAACEEQGTKRPLPNAIICDVGRMGLRLKTEGPLPKDATVLVNFSLPGNEAPIHVKGTVVWSDKHGHAGVHFSSIHPEQSGQLGNWLNARCPWSSDLTLKKSVVPQLTDHPARLAN